MASSHSPYGAPGSEATASSSTATARPHSESPLKSHPPTSPLASPTRKPAPSTMSEIPPPSHTRSHSQSTFNTHPPNHHGHGPLDNGDMNRRMKRETSKRAVGTLFGMGTMMESNESLAILRDRTATPSPVPPLATMAAEEKGKGKEAASGGSKLHGRKRSLSAAPPPTDKERSFIVGGPFRGRRASGTTPPSHSASASASTTISGPSSLKPPTIKPPTGLRRTSSSSASTSGADGTTPKEKKRGSMLGRLVKKFSMVRRGDSFSAGRTSEDRRSPSVSPMDGTIQEGDESTTPPATLPTTTLATAFPQAPSRDRTPPPVLTRPPPPPGSEAGSHGLTPSLADLVQVAMNEQLDFHAQSPAGLPSPPLPALPPPIPAAAPSSGPGPESSRGESMHSLPHQLPTPRVFSPLVLGKHMESSAASSAGAPVQDNRNLNRASMTTTTYGVSAPLGGPGGLVIANPDEERGPSPPPREYIVPSAAPASKARPYSHIPEPIAKDGEDEDEDGESPLAFVFQTSAGVSAPTAPSVLSSSRPPPPSAPSILSATRPSQTQPSVRSVPRMDDERRREMEAKLDLLSSPMPVPSVSGDSKLRARTSYERERDKERVISMPSTSASGHSVAEDPRLNSHSRSRSRSSRPETGHSVSYSVDAVAGSSATATPTRSVHRAGSSSPTKRDGRARDIDLERERERELAIEKDRAREQRHRERREERERDSKSKERRKRSGDRDRDRERGSSSSPTKHGRSSEDRGRRDDHSAPSVAPLALRSSPTKEHSFPIPPVPTSPAPLRVLPSAPVKGPSSAVSSSSHHTRTRTGSGSGSSPTKRTKQPSIETISALGKEWEIVPDDSASQRPPRSRSRDVEREKEREREREKDRAKGKDPRERRRSEDRRGSPSSGSATPADQQPQSRSRTSNLTRSVVKIRRSLSADSSLSQSKSSPTPAAVKSNKPPTAGSHPAPVRRRSATPPPSKRGKSPSPAPSLEQQRPIISGPTAIGSRSRRDSASSMNGGAARAAASVVSHTKSTRAVGPRPMRSGTTPSPSPSYSHSNSHSHSPSPVPQPSTSTSANTESNRRVRVNSSSANPKPAGSRPRHPKSVSTEDIPKTMSVDPVHQGVSSSNIGGVDADATVRRRPRGQSWGASDAASGYVERYVPAYPSQFMTSTGTGTGSAIDADPSASSAGNGIRAGTSHTSFSVQAPIGPGAGRGGGVGGVSVIGSPSSSSASPPQLYYQPATASPLQSAYYPQSMVGSGYASSPYSAHSVALPQGYPASSSLTNVNQILGAGFASSPGAVSSPALHGGDYVQFSNRAPYPIASYPSPSANPHSSPSSSWGSYAANH